MFKNYVSTKCDFCGTEYTLFDENLHGYDAVISNDNLYNSDKLCKYSNESYKIEIIVYYNEDDEEDDLIDDKTLAFGRIKIIKISNNKKKTYCDFECE